MSIFTYMTGSPCSAPRGPGWTPSRAASLGRTCCRGTRGRRCTGDIPVKGENSVTVRFPHQFDLLRASGEQLPLRRHWRRPSFPPWKSPQPTLHGNSGDSLANLQQIKNYYRRHGVRWRGGLASGSGRGSSFTGLLSFPLGLQGKIQVSVRILRQNFTTLRHYTSFFKSSLAFLRAAAVVAFTSLADFRVDTEGVGSFCKGTKAFPWNFRTGSVLIK